MAAEKRVKKLSRKELLEMLVDQGKEIERLKQALEVSEARLADRELKIANSGTMSEAAFALNGVYESVDNAAAQYLENIKRHSAQRQRVYEAAVDDARKIAADIIAEAQRECECRKKLADEYWLDISGRLEDFYASHPGLKEAIEAEMSETSPSEKNDMSASQVSYDSESNNSESNNSIYFENGADPDLSGDSVRNALERKREACHLKETSGKHDSNADAYFFYSDIGTQDGEVK